MDRQADRKIYDSVRKIEYKLIIGKDRVGERLREREREREREGETD